MRSRAYQVREARTPYTDEDTATINAALTILHKRLRQPGESVNSPDTAKHYLRLAYHGLEHERFDVLYLDVKNRLIAHETLFRGTLTQTSVYPREVVKQALKHNAAGVVLAHNHPSGMTEPSDADLHLTAALVRVLELVDVRVLDHFVVTESGIHSFAEHGQL